MSNGKGMHRFLACFLFCLLQGGCATLPNATLHDTDLDVSQLPRVTADSNVMLTLASNQQRTAFTINGVAVGTGKIMSVLVPNRPLTITAKPEGYVEKEDFIQPPFHDNSQIGFYFLKEDRSLGGPEPSRPPPALQPPSTPPRPLPDMITVENSGTPTGSRPQAPAVPLSVTKGSRVALVVGNSGYRNVGRLANPANDARLIARTLQQLGFELVGGGPQLDLEKARFDRAVQEFGRAIPGASAALFYYAGHGLQVQGANWLVPVDANPTRAQDLDFQMVDADLVLRQMDGAGTKLNIIILDACRNNPFASRGLRGMEGGLAAMHAPEGSMIAYATEPGHVAADGSGADSPYSAALANSLRQPGLGIFDTFNQVGLEVEQTTGGAQKPWVSNSAIKGHFCFAGC